MTLILIFVISLLLIFVVIEDFKFRAVRWWAFLLLGVLVIGIENENFNSIDVLVNGCFILIQLAVLSLYFSFKEQKVVNVTRDYLGLGDILFWIVLCLSFSPLNFVFFFIASMLIVMIVVLIWKLTRLKPSMTTIPLAGIQSAVLLILVLMNQFREDISFRNDIWLVEHLII